MRTTPEALTQLLTEDALELFGRYGVFSHREMHSRYEVALEQYVLIIGVEARLTLEIATTIVLPAALRYQTELATNVASLKAIGMDAETGILDEVSSAIKALRDGIDRLRHEVGHEHSGTMEEIASRLQKVDLPAIDAVRTAADELEGLVADDLWPLATYQEMLFIL